MHFRARGFVVVAIFLLVCASFQAPAVAGLVGYTERVEATDSDGHSGWVEIPLPASPGDPFLWNQSSDMNIVDSGDNSVVLGTLYGMNARYAGDPQVTLGFGVTAGPAATTTFTFTSATITFATLTNVQASASASVTLTDNDAGLATLNGLFAGSKAYEAKYGAGLTPSTVFADLITTPVFAADTSTIASERKPPVSGTVPIAGFVSSIRSQYSFNISTDASASGTSTFRVTGDTVVPEPSTMVLLASGLVGLLLVKLRGRRGNKIV